MEITQALVSQCYSLSEIGRRIGIHPNTRNRAKIRNEIITKNIDITHFTLNGSVPIKATVKVCPVCNNPFSITSKNRKEQVTCSYSCSNTYFARKRNYPSRYKNYRTICWHNHDKKCVICGEDKIVAVHHMDEDDTNNDPKNLVPLCPTHHGYWHSRYRRLVREKIEKYIATKFP